MSKVNVTIKFFSTIACEAGCKETELRVSSKLITALEEIERATNSNLYLQLQQGRISLLVNGRSVKLNIQENILKDGDTLAFLPIMGGG
ncbi:MAG: MoaD/ThiS family protein [Bacillota bacterium]|nr:MoaD/ThiS family protein [Bacillota bacterium]